MKVCVFGAGAVGGNLAARMAKGGAGVSVIARGAQLAAIRTDGITVEWQGDTLNERVVATDKADSLGRQDVVVVTLKAPSLAPAAPEIAKLVGPETLVVFAVNGLPWWYRTSDGEGLPELDPDGIIAAHFPRHQVVGGVIYVACSVSAPGHIILLGPSNGLILGDPDDGDSARLEPLVAVLRGGGVQAERTDRIKQAIWRKLALNIASSPLAVLGGHALPRLYAEPELAAAAADLLRETAAVAAAEGYSAETDPAGYLNLASQLAHKPSALQDAEAGRPMEIAALLAAPLAVARRHHVETPVLGLLTALLRVRQS